MSEDDVLFGYRLQLFDYAARTSVSEACRVFGVHRSTFYRWKRMVERHGLEVLRPRERRRPKMPNQLPAMVEERIVAFAIAHPGLGPRRLHPSCDERSGAGSSSPPTASGAVCSGTASTPVRRGSRSSPATGRRTSPRASPSPSYTSRSRGPESSSASTASTSAGCAGRRVRSGS